MLTNPSESHISSLHNRKRKNLNIRITAVVEMLLEEAAKTFGGHVCISDRQASLEACLNHQSLCEAHDNKDNHGLTRRRDPVWPTGIRLHVSCAVPCLERY